MVDLQELQNTISSKGTVTKSDDVFSLIKDGYELMQKEFKKSVGNAVTTSHANDGVLGKGNQISKEFEDREKKIIDSKKQFSS